MRQAVSGNVRRLAERTLKVEQVHGRLHDADADGLVETEDRPPEVVHGDRTQLPRGRDRPRSGAGELLDHLLGAVRGSVLAGAGRDLVPLAVGAPSGALKSRRSAAAVACVGSASRTRSTRCVKRNGHDPPCAYRLRARSYGEGDKLLVPAG